MAVIPFPISTETIIFTHHPPPATIKKKHKKPAAPGFWRRPRTKTKISQFRPSPVIIKKNILPITISIDFSAGLDYQCGTGERVS
jgi:hypothetical protein